MGNSIPTWRTYVTKSTDEGRSWDAHAHELVPGDEGGRGPVKNKLVQLDDKYVRKGMPLHVFLDFVDLSQSNSANTDVCSLPYYTLEFG